MYIYELELVYMHQGQPRVRNKAGHCNPVGAAAQPQHAASKKTAALATGEGGYRDDDVGELSSDVVQHVINDASASPGKNHAGMDASQAADAPWESCKYAWPRGHASSPPRRRALQLLSPRSAPLSCAMARTAGRTYM